MKKEVGDFMVPLLKDFLLVIIILLDQKKDGHLRLLLCQCHYRDLDSRFKYLGMLCMILVAILVFTVLAFIITNNGTGHTASGLRFKEYQLEDYSSWFRKQLNNTENWKHLKSCLEDCNNLPKKYKDWRDYPLRNILQMQAITPYYWKQEMFWAESWSISKCTEFVRRTWY